jgi:hypothetical protein
MRNKVKAITLLVATGAGALAISVAPIAAARSTGYSTMGADNEGQTPGNVQINDSAFIQYAPEYP